MDILFLLIPLSVALVFAILVVFAWAVFTGQFDDLEREGERILEAGNASARAIHAATDPGLDTDQTGKPGLP